MTTRRTVLRTLAGLPLLPACTDGLPPAALLDPVDDDDAADDDDSALPDDDDSGDDDDSTAEPAPPFVVEGAEDLGSFPSGLQVTDALPDAVLVALRTIEPSVVLRLGLADGDALVFESAPLTSPDGILSLELVDLQPDTAYQLYAVDPAAERRSSLTRFRTALAPGSSRPLRVAVTSCLGRGGAPWRSMQHASFEAPDLCLLLGDTVYADGATSLDDYRGSWDEALETEGLRLMSGVTSFVATWDDHEVDNNWTWAGAADRFESALSAFRESLPQRAGPAEDRVYRSLRWGDVAEIVVLDCRADRGGGLYISEAQMAWVQDTLRTSTARFKLILNSVPIIDFSDWIGNVSADDRWQGTPAQREELLAFVEGEGIEGVLFLGGDMHFGSVCRVSPEGSAGEGLWEVMAGPSGSFINPIAYIPPSWAPQYDLVVAEWNTVLLTLDPDSGTVGVSFVGDSGDVLDERQLEL